MPDQADELLKKYMLYVRLCEGTDFIYDGIQPYHEAEEAGLTKSDIETLTRLSQEI